MVLRFVSDSSPRACHRPRRDSRVALDCKTRPSPTRQAVQYTRGQYSVPGDLARAVTAAPEPLPMAKTNRARGTISGDQHASVPFYGSVLSLPRESLGARSVKSKQRSTDSTEDVEVDGAQRVFLVCLPITYSYRIAVSKNAGETACPLIMILVPSPGSCARAEGPRRQTAGGSRERSREFGGMQKAACPCVLGSRKPHVWTCRWPGRAQPLTTLRSRSRLVILLPRWASFSPTCRACGFMGHRCSTGGGIEEKNCGGVTSLAPDRISDRLLTGKLKVNQSKTEWKQFWILVRFEKL